MALDVVIADEDDAVLLAQILSEAARHKGEAHNDDAWKSQSTGKYDYTPDGVMNYIQRGDTYLVYLDKVAIGTIALQRDDTSVWGPRLPNEAAYIHRLAIRDSARGKNYGAGIIAWANTEAKLRGCRYLRLDVPPTNIGLRKYYEKLGFKHKTMSAVPLRLKSSPVLVYKAALYEKPVN